MALSSPILVAAKVMAEGGGVHGVVSKVALGLMTVVVPEIALS